MKAFILLCFVALFGMSTAAPTNDNIKKVTIKTSAVCEMCKVRIEKVLNGLEGVEDAELDLVTKNVKIKYDEDVIQVTQLKQAITMAGYGADDLPARPKAVDALPNCCKPDSTCGKKGGDMKSCHKPSESGS